MGNGYNMKDSLLSQGSYYGVVYLAGLIFLAEPFIVFYEYEMGLN